MYSEIKIGKTTVPMRSSGLTAHIYKRLFGKDLLKQFISVKETNDISFLRELAFVMAWQAKDHAPSVSHDLQKLSINEYFDWLDRYSEMDFMDQNTLLEIENCWLENTKSTADLKN